MVCRSSKSWDERRKVAIESLKKQIEKYSKSPDESAKSKLKNAQAVLCATEANLGKGLSGLRNKTETKVEIPR